MTMRVATPVGLAVARLTVILSAIGWAILLVHLGFVFAQGHAANITLTSVLFDASLFVITTTVGLKNSRWI